MDVQQPREELLASLSNCYDAYRAAYDRTARYNNINELLASLVIRRADGGSRGIILDELREEAEGLIAALLPLLEAAPEDAGRCALAALETLLFYPLVKGDRARAMSLAALEGIAAPLLSYVPGAQLPALIRRYRKRTPPRLMFPVQKQLFLQMQLLAAKK